jgi:predicted metal-binding membrane protein
MSVADVFGRPPRGAVRRKSLCCRMTSRLSTFRRSQAVKTDFRLPGEPTWRNDLSMVGDTSPDNRPATILESALRHDRAPVVVLLIVVPLVSWLWIVAMARDMYGPMTGASAWMMTAVWDPWHLVLLWAMWAVMMVAMMLPSASPMLLLYGTVARRSAVGAGGARQLYAFAAGYLVVWAAFSVGATALQRLLAALLVVSPMMEVTSRVAGATLLKHACLRTCQSPLGFLMSRWRPRVAGAFRMGLEHGAVCVGCCWALMLLLFAGGVMNLAVIATLTALVAFEKLTRFGVYGAHISGILLIAAAAWMVS